MILEKDGCFGFRFWVEYRPNWLYVTTGERVSKINFFSLEESSLPFNWLIVSALHENKHQPKVLLFEDLRMRRNTQTPSSRIAHLTFNHRCGRSKNNLYELRSEQKLKNNLLLLSRCCWFLGPAESLWMFSNWTSSAHGIRCSFVKRENNSTLVWIWQRSTPQTVVDTQEWNVCPERSGN